MGSIFDAMYHYLSQWDQAYANRWMAFIRSTHNTWEDDIARACRFWQLELSALETAHARHIREHLVPQNDLGVIMDIFVKEVMPLLIDNPKLFTRLSLSWGSIY